MQEPVIPGVPVTEYGKSSLAIEQNSKGEPAIKVKLYCDSNAEADVDATAAKLVEVYKRLLAEVAGA